MYRTGSRSKGFKDETKIRNHLPDFSRPHAIWAIFQQRLSCRQTHYQGKTTVASRHGQWRIVRDARQKLFPLVHTGLQAPFSKRHASPDRKLPPVACRGCGWQCSLHRSCRSAPHQSNPTRKTNEESSGSGGNPLFPSVMEDCHCMYDDRGVL